MSVSVWTSGRSSWCRSIAHLLGRRWCRFWRTRAKEAFPSSSFVEELSQEEFASEPADPEAVHVGDTITYAFADDPSREITITITENEYDVGRGGLLPRHHPLSETFLRIIGTRGVHVGDELLIPAGGKLREAVVVRMLKPQSHMFDEFDRAEQHDRADCRADDRAYEAEADVNTNVAKKPATEECTDNSDQDIRE